jgi:GT2 family glycosyltransferase
MRGQYWTGGDQVDTGWVPGAAMMIRRDAVEQVGLLDERFFLYGEDIEWCWRMRSAGWSIGVCSTVIARHIGGSSSNKTFPDEIGGRLAEGVFRAVSATRGVRFARAYYRAKEFELRLEALHPRRTAEHRQACRDGVEAARAARLKAHELEGNDC